VKGPAGKQEAEKKGPFHIGSTKDSVGGRARCKAMMQGWIARLPILNISEKTAQYQTIYN